MSLMTAYQLIADNLAAAKSELAKTITDRGGEVAPNASLLTMADVVASLPGEGPVGPVDPAMISNTLRLFPIVAAGGGYATGGMAITFDDGNTARIRPTINDCLVLSN